MADFFFFTDIDLLVSQTSDEAFGPILPTDSAYDANKEKYRLTSIHKATSNPLAYAICKGQVLVQEDSTNSTLVNIILKPEVQPKNDLPVIKYYIYRGILKNSLTDGTNVISGSNTLTKHILDNNVSTPKKVLGIELTGTNYSVTDNIDNAFYLPKVGFELWTVYGGWSIGTFDKNGFGLDIVFERLGYNPDFNIARLNKNEFEIQKLTGTPSQADEFEYKTKKEVVLNYIDPCAFYGNFYSDAINARSSADSIDSGSLPSFNKKKGDEIYREIIEGGTLTTPSNNYYNKNIIYLDIRNDLNFSFNYFENYDNNLKASFIDDNNQPTILIDYYNLSWPILKLDSLPIGNNKTTIKIAFPTNDNANPCICILSANRKYSLIEKIKNGKSKFFNLSIDPLNQSYSSNSLTLQSPNYNNSLSVCQYIKLKYINKIEQIPASNISPLNILKKEDSLDMIFDLKSLITHSNFIQNNVDFFVFNEGMYIDSFEDYDCNFLGNIGYTQNNNEITLLCFAQLIDSNERIKVFSNNLNFSNSSVNNNIFEYIKNKRENYVIDANTLNFATGSVNIIRYKVLKKQKRFIDVDINKIMLLISISKADWNNISSIISSTFVNYSPVSFIFKNRNDKDNDLTNDMDLNEINYKEVEIFLTGLIETSGALSKAQINTNVKLYSFQNN